MENIPKRWCEKNITVPPTTCVLPDLFADLQWPVACGRVIAEGRSTALFGECACGAWPW